MIWLHHEISLQEGRIAWRMKMSSSRAAPWEPRQHAVLTPTSSLGANPDRGGIKHLLQSGSAGAVLRCESHGRLYCQLTTFQSASAVRTISLCVEDWLL